jgi:chemotaxis protein MotB
MVSYADFITLLFAVFVVLFASSQSGSATPAQISQAVAHALDNGSVAEAIKVMRALGSPAQTARSGQVAREPDLASSLEALNGTLKEEIADGKIAVQLDPRGLVISLRQAAFFPSGEAHVQPAAYSIVDKVGETLGALPNAVRLEGHTDAIPIRNSRFANNWELSAMRSIAMVELLVQRNHIDRRRLSVAGFAETDPLASNDDEEGRAKNRRVDIVILNTASEARPPQ